MMTMMTATMTLTLKLTPLWHRSTQIQCTTQKAQPLHKHKTLLTSLRQQTKPPTKTLKTQLRRRFGSKSLDTPSR